MFNFAGTQKADIQSHQTKEFWLYVEDSWDWNGQRVWNESFKKKSAVFLNIGNKTFKIHIFSKVIFQIVNHSQ